MAIYGLITDTDLSSVGNICLMGLIGIVLVGFVNIMVLDSEILDTFICCIGVMVFVGLTAYDTQKIKERVEKIKSRIQESISRLEQVDYDRNRFEQEMIYYIEKLDINEEKLRLTNHLDYFLETLENGHGQGKKLGFISQEMGREINTLGSKSNHAEMQRIVVKMKDELEQIKEQVLNVM